MNTLIHLCRKDYSFAKHVLLGSWVVFLVAALMPRFISGALAEAAMAILGPLWAVQYFQVFASVLKILRADSFSGGNAFIGTRPVTMTMLWLSKLVAIAAFVLLPWLLAQVISVFALRVHLTPADWLLFLAEKKLLFGLPTAIALIVGTHTRNFVWTSMLTIAFTFSIIWLAVSIFSRSGGLNFIMEGLELKTSQCLVAQVLISIAAILLAWLWMAQRRMSWSIAAGVSALALIAAVSTQWKVNFVKRLSSSEVDANIMASDLRIAWLGEPHISSSSRNNVPITRVVREACLDGVPDGWISNFSGVRSHARFRDGSRIAGVVANSQHSGYYTRALLPSLSLEAPLKGRSLPVFPTMTTWFEAETSLLRERTDQTSMISGGCMVELDQPVVLANLPPLAGTSASHGRFRYHVDQVEATGSDISLKLVVVGVDLASRGDLRNKHDDIEILLINPKTGEHTSIGGTCVSWSSGPGWLLIHHRPSIDDGLPGPDREATDPRVFLKDARLYLIGGRYGGTVRVPFEMKDVDLAAGR